MVEITGKWKCPRCGEKVDITQDGIYHASNVNGPHFQKYTLGDLNALRDFEEKQLNKIFYGGSKEIQ